jgi:hypothetical protein
MSARPDIFIQLPIAQRLAKASALVCQVLIVVVVGREDSFPAD